MSRLLICLLFLLLLTSCMDNGRAGRSSIQNYSLIDSSGTEYCTAYTEISYESCTTECAEGYHIGTDEEISEEIETYISNLSDSSVDESEVRAELAKIIEYAAGICIETPDSRPTGEVYINPKYCACEDGKPYIINDCESFCSSNSSENPTLYVTTEVGSSISSHEKLGTTKNWCTVDLDDSQGPGCVLQLFDGLNTLQLEMNFTGDFTFTVDLTNKIEKNKTYVAHIVETVSKAKSEAFQIHAIDIESSEYDNSPLKIMPISQYSCIYLYADTEVTTSSLATDYYASNLTRIYLTYPSNKLPDVSSGVITNLFCHDIIKYGTTDNILYPRLELISNAFALWDLSDIRFYSTTDDSRLDINIQIENRLSNEYGISSTINIFNELKIPTSIVQEEGDSDSTFETYSIKQGVYMQPWIDANTQLGYCPKQADYNGDTAVFRILKELVGIDTEALYMAKSSATSTVDTSGNTIYVAGSTIIIRESVLKKIWFYYENGQALEPNDTIAGQKEILFYYPPDPNYASPYVKKSYQKLFKVFNPAEEEYESSDSTRPTVVPPNKMFGCVPSLGDTAYIQRE